MIHHDELALRPGFVEPPGGHERTAHIEAAVDQDGGKLGNASGVAPSVTTSRLFGYERRLGGLIAFINASLLSGAAYL